MRVSPDAILGLGGTFNLIGGTINGRVVETSGGEKLAAPSGSNTLSGLTFRGRLDVSGGTTNFAAVNEGVINLSGARLNLNGGWNNAAGGIAMSAGILQFGGTHALPGAPTNVVRTGGDVYLGATANNAGNTFDSTRRPARVNSSAR